MHVVLHFMPVAIWPIAYIDSYSEVWGGWRRSVEGGGREDQAPAGQSPRAAHLEATEREVISSSFAWPRC